MLEAEMNDMDMLGELWGTSPLSIAGYFDFHKIKRGMYQGESTFDRFIKSIKKAKIAIISLWNDHFIMVFILIALSMIKNPKSTMHITKMLIVLIKQKSILSLLLKKKKAIL